MPVKVTLRFYEELNDFLPLSRRKKAFSITYSGNRTVKDIIEAEGIPHTEVDLILVNQQPVDFDYHPADNDYISVYPIFESIDISGIATLRPRPLRIPRFVLDVHLGTLARYLRMLGFDSLYRNDYTDEELLRISIEEHRTLLTRDLPLLKNGRLTHGYFIRETQPARQLSEVVRRFDLKEQISLFGRCMDCNGLIEKVEKIEVAKDLRQNTLMSFHEFYRCRSCRKVYWKGSHYERMLKLIRSCVPSTPASL